MKLPGNWNGEWRSFRDLPMARWCERRWVAGACFGEQGLREGDVELRAGMGRGCVLGRSRLKRGPSLRSG
jgi:hypothetical protein